MPPRTLAWLPTLRLTVVRRDDDEQRHVASANFGKVVNAVRPRPDGARHETGFLEQLTPGTLFDGLPGLEMPARRRPCSGAMTAKAFAKQHSSVPHDQHPDANVRLEVVH